MYFPMVYDIKHMMKFCNSLHGGLNKLAELLEVERVGVCHQAGSDSLLASCTFRKFSESGMFMRKSTQGLYWLGMHHVIRALLLPILHAQQIKASLISKGLQDMYQLGMHHSIASDRFSKLKHAYKETLATPVPYRKCIT
ncbi:hypothetical protein F3Y22_tig00109987pilonHSYRG00207 [Hibiscus syriacus]|uniref:Uncharacterized protein n=1 Tax=Hibiscus syriacus TaxID=106335 RepID=A0A6A3BSB3_HIBSY|nr:hypothetical protein F3Y22_tig00109987pilonHSYRG00207 [Hibiscus syriacus]